MRQITAFLLLMVWFSGCAMMVPPPNPFDQIHIGQSTQQVRELLGNPDDRELQERKERWFYRRYDKILVFKEGKLAKMMRDKAAIKRRHELEKAERQATKIQINQGANGGPQVPGAYSAATATPIQHCQSSIDCRRGFCKDRGDGVKMCMDEMGPGEFCQSSLDCADGFCKDRGDGLKICMDEMPPGGFCQSSLDCADGFCKDRGDGLKVCM